MDFILDCTGDVVVGDSIRFKEAVFSRSTGRRKLVGIRTITARVLRDSYGEKRQQHTFTIEVIACVGVEPIEAGTVTTRKGRNIYRRGTKRAAWADEDARRPVAEEKHRRGDAARAEREIRIAAREASRAARATSPSTAGEAAAPSSAPKGDQNAARRRRRRRRKPAAAP